MVAAIRKSPPPGRELGLPRQGEPSPRSTSSPPNSPRYQAFAGEPQQGELTPPASPAPNKKEEGEPPAQEALFHDEEQGDEEHIDGDDIGLLKCFDKNSLLSRSVDWIGDHKKSALGGLLAGGATGVCCGYFFMNAAATTVVLMTIPGAAGGMIGAYYLTKAAEWVTTYCCAKPAEAMMHDLGVEGQV